MSVKIENKNYIALCCKTVMSQNYIKKKIQQEFNKDFRKSFRLSKSPSLYYEYKNINFLATKYKIKKK